MTKTVTATEAGAHFQELLQEVSEGGATSIVEREGEALAVVLPREEYARLREQRGRGAWREALELAGRSRERVRRELNGRSLVPPEEAIREGREARVEQITGLR